ncbi:hypothetical protein [Negadavirga shengliensis]|uniref:Antibiotic biosynthesis monooxygenase n=1 Tax=Negadavirga shengliensis TaxID=1389218 RepID=A0ABV9T280_9BACT
MKYIVLIIVIFCTLALRPAENNGNDHDKQGNENLISNQNKKNMYVIRNVFQAKPGKAKDLVKVFKQAGEVDPNIKNLRIMTDISADFWTVVVENEVESLDQEAADARSYTSSPEMKEIFKDYLDYIESGYREIFILE